MKIAVLKEAAGETRCAAIPETVKKFIALGAEVAVETGAGEQAFIPDADFEAAGAKIASRADVLNGSVIILAVDHEQLFKQSQRRSNATATPMRRAARPYHLEIRLAM